MSRRRFLKTSATLSAAALTGLLRPQALAQTARPKVYSATHPSMVTGTTPSTVDEGWVKAALDACAKGLSGKASVGEAYQSFFPGITPTKRIAIKLGLLKAQVAPQFATLKALVQGLTAMCAGQFPAKNIYLFDNTMPFAGFAGAGRLQAFYGAQGIANLGVVYADPTPQYAATTFTVRGRVKHPATYLDQADYGISLAPLKRHQYFAGGVSGVIKNLMGAVSESTSEFTGAKETFHDEAPYQSFQDLMKNYMRAKMRLYVVDMLFAANAENATGWAKLVKRVTLGTDPCAVDAYFADVLIGAGITQNVTPALPRALAAAGLGNADYQLVEPAVLKAGAPTTRADLDRLIERRRAGQGDDQEVKDAIRRYRQ